uniref:Uncharacterized protein n=1 Tax=viral metagenome TaxID=1070528 RepID=A0A6H1ZQW8_9ZZZZ
MDADTIQAMAVVHGEMRGQPDEAKINAISSLINRRLNFNTNWAFRGDWNNMLEKEYYAIRDSKSGKNLGYQQAMDRLTKGKPLPTEEEENDFKRTIQLWNVVSRNPEKQTKAEFYWDKEEEANQRKALGKGFNQLVETGSFEDKKGKKFKTFSYKRD